MPPYRYDKYRNSSKIPSGLRRKVLLLHIRLYCCGSSKKTRIHGTRLMVLFLIFILKCLNWKNIKEMEGIVLRINFNSNILNVHEVLLFWHFVFKGNLTSGATGDIIKLIISTIRDGSFLLDGQILLCQCWLQVGLWKPLWLPALCEADQNLVLFWFSNSYTLWLYREIGNVYILKQRVRKSCPNVLIPVHGAVWLSQQPVLST